MSESNTHTPSFALALTLTLALTTLLTTPVLAQRQMEQLDRGVVAVDAGDGNAFISWRLLATDPDDIAFNVYRRIDMDFPTKLNDQPITDRTCFLDTSPNLDEQTSYFVRPVVNGSEQSPSKPFTLNPGNPYISIPLSPPDIDFDPNRPYHPNDGSAADLDGDGQYELVIKWVGRGHDNSHSGPTDPVFFQAVELDGTVLWTINLGINVRAGAHYTPFLVYDFDGNGYAELAVRTADGTTDAQGNVIGDPDADHRNDTGRINTGPEFLTVFDGRTGRALDTVPYEPARGDVSQWGDDYGNRSDRFLACVAYLNGKTPSIVMCRGYYGPQRGFDARNELAAFDFQNGQITQRWHFRAHTEGPNRDYIGQGAHSVTVGDVDNDNKDEIIYGAAAIDDDGTGLYNTRLGHGDALHMGDLDPSHPGQEVWMVHESSYSYGDAGGEFRDADSGELLFGVPGDSDIGRGVGGNIFAEHPGAEMWAAGGGAPPHLYNTDGEVVGQIPDSANFLIWWDGDLTRELLDRTYIANYRPDGRDQRILEDDEASSNNGTKATPVLSADLLGDWREEVIWRARDNSHLRLYTTTHPTDHRFYTLMHDPQYRLAIAWQNVAYNQPPHPSFYIGQDMNAPPQPNITIVPAPNASR